MSSSRCPLYIVVLAFLLTRGNGGRTVITPENSSVIEHSPLRLNCFYTDYSALPTTTTCRWSIVKNGTSRTIAIFYKYCLLRNYFEEMYSFECTNQTANSLIINSTDRSLHGTVFSCSYIVNDTPVSGYSTIRVSVPLSRVNLIQPETDVVITTENRKVAFTCNASASHLKPNITWYIDSQAPFDYKSVEITKNITEVFDYDGYLYAVMSNLSFYPTKYDNGSRIYCNASNTERNISSTRKTLLYVQYKAAIKYFGAAEFENNQSMMTVNQSEKTQIICRVQSNPFSNSTIFFKGRLVNETIRSDTVTYNLVNSKCSDAGRYICKGKNEYNYEADASKELILYVKCLPQPSADQPPEKNVSAALSDSAVFRFYAAPYYDPGITEFRWFKQENDNKMLLRNSAKTYISSSDTHSVLRINDVLEADYGMYIVEYNNSVGMNNFTFYLQQSDQIVSEEIHHDKDNNYLQIILGIVIAVLVIVGITLGIVIYIKRYKQTIHSNNSNRSHDNICRMNTKSGGNNTSWELVYEGLKPADERGYVEMKEQTYDILKPKDLPDPKDPVYTNLKL